MENDHERRREPQTRGLGEEAIWSRGHSIIFKGGSAIFYYYSLGQITQGRCKAGVRDHYIHIFGCRRPLSHSIHHPSDDTFPHLQCLSSLDPYQCHKVPFRTTSNANTRQRVQISPLLPPLPRLHYRNTTASMSSYPTP
jgi:hypothetical protein